ncbi:MAG TPA: methyl-accepting chemotaxis protein [Candidatus Limnocylindria bacterium]|jgi:methyl-accepting chemotaxis protein|nr:methyl-accepting chemotaxis protein [Candidatus Limnocylindria bacterium]
MNKLGLKSRMTLIICSVILLALGVIITLEVRETGQFARTKAFNDAEQLAHRYAGEAERTLNEALLAARTVAQTFEGMKAAWVDDRSMYNSILKQVVVANTNFLAVWSGWQPDGLDGKDKTFANKAGHDETGRFVPLWYRTTNDANLAPLTGYAAEDTGAYYLKTVKLGREQISDPFARKMGDRTNMVIGLVAPIRYNGEITGVAGVDVSLGELQGLISTIHPYDTGYASLSTTSGRFVAHADTGLIGQQLFANGLPKNIQETLATGKSYASRIKSASGADLYQVIAPVLVGGTQTPWYLAVNIPTEKILAESNRALWRGVAAGGIAFLVMIVVVGLLARSIAKPLLVLTGNLGQAATQLNETADRLNQTSRIVADGAHDQAASLEETAASLEEMASMTRRNAENAVSAKSLAGEARTAADAGSIEMEQLSTAMHEIKASGDSITKIIRTIDEIAFQTNILALNAAVEAARAGESGLGFAVVADEVRNLARRSAAAAKETSEKISDAISKSEKGVILSQKVTSGLKGIVDKVRQVDDLVAEIATASNEQSDGIAQINTAVSKMDQVTQSNASTAEQTSHAVREVDEHAKGLNVAVGQLQVLVLGGTTATSAATTAAPTKQSPPDASPSAPIAGVIHGVGKGSDWQNANNKRNGNPAANGAATKANPENTTAKNGDRFAFKDV